MRILAILMVLLLPLAPAKAYDWPPGNYILTGSVFPNCLMGLGRLWKDDNPATGPIHIRMHNNARQTMHFTWQAELVTPRGGHVPIGGGVVAVAPFAWGVANSVPANQGDIQGTRIVVTISACTPA